MRGLFLLCLVFLISMLAACAGSGVNSRAYTVGAYQDRLGDSFRSVDERISLARRARLDFFAPRFYRAAARSYEKVLMLRGQRASRYETDKYAHLVMHSLKQAQATKQEVLRELDEVLEVHQTLERIAAYRDFPIEFERLETDLNEVIELVELKLLSPATWRVNKKPRFDGKKSSLLTEMRSLVQHVTRQRSKHTASLDKVSGS